MASIGLADKETLDNIDVKANNIDINVWNTRQQVGRNTDAASATGTLHAKVAEVNNTLVLLSSVAQKARHTIRQTATFNSTTNAERITVVGKGTLLYLAVRRAPDTTSAPNGVIGVRIDGSLVGQGGYSEPSIYNVHMPTASFWGRFTNSNQMDLTDYFMPALSFTTGFAIEGYRKSGGYTEIICIYEIE